MAIKVHGSRISTCVGRVIACLEEKGVEYEVVPVDYVTSEHKQQPFLSLNPFGQVPAFEDGDLTLFESRAITRYVSRKYKDIGTDLLRLNNLAESAIVDAWMEAEAHQFNGPMKVLIYQFFIRPFHHLALEEQEVETNSEKLGKVLEIYEERLSKYKYLAGDYFTLADLHHIPFIFYLFKTPKAYLITSRPHVNAWWNDISSRPSSIKISEGFDKENSFLKGNQ
ncbi:hypothetical protein HHK36_026472 [Tetracentron sinense]|uniref:glutathione transferase n=1 Tax=Tetracentron sinense TaxID=13715 RepID=A0A835D5I3_TETSI|nr:hypothetical protein HHK36_026472 [Tetracentron sinense]